MGGNFDLSHPRCRISHAKECNRANDYVLPRQFAHSEVPQQLGHFCFFDERLSDSAHSIGNGIQNDYIGQRRLTPVVEIGDRIFLRIRADAILSYMDFAQAIQKANNILNEERVLPTVTYVDSVADWMEDVKKRGKDARLTPEAVKAMTDREKLSASEPHFNLHHERGLRPRIVHESPYQYDFRRVNFDLLRILLGQIQEGERDLFVPDLLARLPSDKASK